MLVLETSSSSKALSFASKYTVKIIGQLNKDRKIQFKLSKELVYHIAPVVCFELAEKKSGKKSGPVCML